MQPETFTTSNRSYILDLVRFLASMSVLIYHYTYRGWAANHISPVTFSSLGAITRYGYLGVEIFFMISGYVVLMSAYNKTLKQFFLSRVTRLYPAYWVACVITFLAIRALASKPGMEGYSYIQEASFTQLAVNLTMFQSFLRIRDIDTSYWSLSYELVFYGLIAVLIGFKLMKRLDIFLLLWLSYTAWATPAAHGLDAVLLLPRYSPYFISGMLFYIAQKKIMPSWKIWSLLLASFVLALQCAKAQVHTQQAFYQAHFSYSVAAAAVTGFHLLFFLIIYRKLTLDRLPWLQVAGALTYPLYLLHGNIGWLFFQRLPHVNKYAVLWGLIFIMLMAAYLIHIWIEKRWSKPLGQLVSRGLAVFQPRESSIM